MAYFASGTDLRSREFRQPTEDIVARRFATEHAGKLRYCHEARAWFAWDGALWRRDRTGTTLQLVRDIARELSTDPFGKTFQASGRTAFVAGVERFARCDPLLAVGAEAWPDNPTLLGTPEGPIDLTSGLKAEAKPEDGLRLATAVTPPRDSHCPTWRRFLYDACGEDGDLSNFLCRYLGYALTGRVHEQAMVFVCGPGGTGKTVFLNTILHVMGDYARPAGLDMLTGADVDRRGADLAGLRGVRLVGVAESERERRWDERRLKLLTGGDPVTCGGGRHFTPTFKLIVTGNEAPRLDVVDDAVRRRLCIVPFRHKPKRPDRNLEAKLRTEAPAILRWMIEAARDGFRSDLGLLRCPAVEEANSAYFSAQDMLGLFLAERCEGSPGDWTRSTASAELYRAWCEWAEAIGEPAGSQRAFAEALGARGFPRRRTEAVRYYVGLELKMDDA